MTARKPRGRHGGTLIIIGGHEDHEGERDILKEVAAHVHKRRLVLATIASHEPEGYLEQYQKSFSELGINDVSELYIDDRSDALSVEKLKLLEGVDAIFFSGGDQLRITSQIGDTPVFERVRQIFEDGGVIAGTSAGATAIGETMLVAGQSRNSFRLGDLHLAPGLGLIRNVIIDQHFAQRGRIGRLLGAVAQNPRMLGLGIDEDTAVVAEGQRFRVIGSGAVYVVDGSATSYSNVSEGHADAMLSISDVRLHVLKTGDSFDLEARRPQPGPADEETDPGNA